MEHPRVKSILQTVVVASAGLLLAAAIPLARDALTDPLTVAIAVATFIAAAHDKTRHALDYLGSAVISLSASSFGLIAHFYVILRQLRLHQSDISVILDIWTIPKSSTPCRRSPRPTRLDTFRLLVSREPDGVAAGELARLIEVPQNTMSTHLAILARAGLVRGERHSRSIIYRADLERFREVTLFLLKDCCGGRPEVCAPLIADLTPCCPPKESAHG